MNKRLKHTKPVVVEVMFKGEYCLPCHFMDLAVQDIIDEYSDYVEYRRVEIMKGEGKKRYLALSVSLFGEEGVYRHKRIAPLPSLFIDGELVFDTIPPRFELEEALEEAVSPYRSDHSRRLNQDDGERSVQVHTG